MSNQLFYFGSNFKMHQTPQESVAFIRDLKQLRPSDLSAQLFVIPPFTSLTTVSDALDNSNIWLGGQTMHWAAEGAFTGEISGDMLIASGATLVMLGHAERRQLFGETDQALRKKVARAFRVGLRVLLCVGEDAQQREDNLSKEITSRQLQIALADVECHQISGLLIAYEPVWSIGEGGRPASPTIVADMHNSIREWLLNRFGATGHSVPILYGGSVNEQNCGDYAPLEQVDGLFVGRAAWSPQGYISVLQQSLAAQS